MREYYSREYFKRQNKKKVISSNLKDTSIYGSSEI